MYLFGGFIRIAYSDLDHSGLIDIEFEQRNFKQTVSDHAVIRVSPFGIFVRSGLGFFCSNFDPQMPQFLPLPAGKPYAGKPFRMGS